MKPITTSFLTGKDTCTPISSDCVVWNGPDLPCVTEPCNGESATNVLQLMADKLCELSDELSSVMEVDLSCLLTNAEPPTNLQELQQLVIDKVCEALDNGGGGGTDPGGQKTLYPLPLCLQYVDNDQNTVTSAELNDFLDLVADKVCEIVADIVNIQDDITDLDARVTVLENANPVITPATLPNVTLTCTNSTPGTAKPITTAIVEFENAYCQFRVLTGSNSEISTIINKECAGLDTADSLSNPSLQMNQLTGWVTTPTTMTQMLNNMWITLCDIRSKVIDCCSNITNPCSPFPVSKISINNVNDQSFDISWNNPNVGSFEPPVEFNVDVFDVLNGQPTGGALLSETYTYPVTFPITVLNTLDPGTTYAVVVTAVYSCGSMSTTTTAVLNEAIPLDFCVDITETDLPNTTVTCDGSKTQTNKKLTFTLYDTATNNVIQAPSNLSIQIVFTREDNCDTPASTTSSVANIILSQGNSSLDYTYIAAGWQDCGGGRGCSSVTLTPNCISLGTIPNSTVTICPGNKLTTCNSIPN
jgi:hypothetical protein